MNILIFNGSLETSPSSTAHKLTTFLKDQLQANGASVTVFHLAEADIPLFDFSFLSPPRPVLNMVRKFREADRHIWLTPLYHGSMTGAMKNCLDWLEVSASEDAPYLTHKVVGLVSWADGGQAMQGINAMDSVAKALRAWVLPYSIPIIRGHFSSDSTNNITPEYHRKLTMMTELITKKKLPH